MEEKICKFIEKRNLTGNPEDIKKHYRSLIQDFGSSTEFKRELEIHKVLANKDRLKIYKLLDKESLCNCVLSYILNKSASTINRHLKIMEQAELIIGKKEGYFVFYYTRENFAKEFMFTNNT